MNFNNMVMTDLCPIWGLAAKKERLSGYIDVARYLSPRSGGAYEIDGLTEIAVQTLTLHEKLKLTTWLVSQRLLGNLCPKVDSEAIAYCKQMRPLSVSQRRDRLLQYIALQCPRLDDQLYIGPESDQLTLYQYFAQTESDTWAEIQILLDFSSKFIQAYSKLLSGQMQISLSFAGFEKLEVLSQRLTSTSQAFVAMWFDTSMMEAFEKGIAPSIVSAGYTPLRIDRKEHNNKIDDEIIAEIRRSRFVVADFMCPLVNFNGATAPIARGGVYYEAGFAQGFGLPVIWTCRKNMIDYVHFDTRQYAHIDWETPEELRDKLSKRISATLGDGPVKRPN